MLWQAWRRRHRLLIIGVEFIFISEEFWSPNILLLRLFSVNYLYLYWNLSQDARRRSTQCANWRLNSASLRELIRKKRKVMKEFLCLGATVWLGQITRLIRATVCSRSWRQVITFFSLISSFYTSSKRAEKHETIAWLLLFLAVNVLP
jgi:hypothetical protein